MSRHQSMDFVGWISGFWMDILNIHRKMQYGWTLHMFYKSHIWSKKCSTLPKNASTGFRKWCSLRARHIQSCSYIARPQPSCCVKNHLQSFLLQSEVKDPKLLTYQWYKFLGFQEEVMRLIWLTHIQLMRWYLPTKNYRPSPSIVIYWVLFSFALEVHCRDREGWIYA